MSVGFLVLAAWLVNAAAGTVEYDDFMAMLSTLPGRLLLVGWSFAFFFHLGNGIRHLAWDAGHGFEKRQANASAWLVLAFAALATAALWLVST